MFLGDLTNTSALSKKSTGDVTSGLVSANIPVRLPQKLYISLYMVIYTGSEYPKTFNIRLNTKNAGSWPKTNCIFVREQTDFAIEKSENDVSSLSNVQTGNSGLPVGTAGGNTGFRPRYRSVIVFST